MNHKKSKSRRSSSSSSDGDGTRPAYKRFSFVSPGSRSALMPVTSTAAMLDEVSEIDLDSMADRDILISMYNTMKEVKADISTLKTSYQTFEDKLGNCTRAIEIIDDKCEVLSNTMMDKLADLEDRSRRNNIIVYGIPEATGETWEKSEQLVREVITDLGEVESEIELDRTHRMGKKGGPTPRPIIARFLRWKDKTRVLEKARSRLKNTDVKMGEDFSEKVRAQRKNLIPHMVQARKEGKWASLRFDKLLIDKVPHVIDKAGNLVSLNRYVKSQNDATRSHTP